MTANTSTCHPGDSSKALTRLPQLAEPLMQFDLVSELQQLRAKNLGSGDRPELQDAREVSRFFGSCWS